MGLTIFSDKVIKSSSERGVIDITPLAQGDKRIRKEINKVFQQANRRIQNVKKAGLASPAVKAVIAERGEKGFTYFSIAGLNPENASDFEKIKYEYGRAMSFLKNPTSSATGARQYIKYQQSQLRNATFESANKLVDIATNPTIDEYGNVNIFSYGSILDTFRNDVAQIENDMNLTQTEYEQELEKRLQEVANDMLNSKSYLNFLDRFF